MAKLNYRRQEQASQEGDFSLKGDTLTVFPANFSFLIKIEWDFDTVKKIYSFDSQINKKILDYNFLIILPFVKKRRRGGYSENMPLDIVLKIEPGDHVVHNKYGIGIFRGVKKLKNSQGKWEHFFEIEYAQKDKLYISSEEAHLIQKYINLGGRYPKLSRLGTQQWQRIKERAHKGIRKFALELVRMQAQREIIGGFKFSKDNAWQKIFEERFEFSETPDQLKAIREVKEDMESSRCMDRLICGDVGYGKTEVALRAAFKAVMDSKQVAVLVPTTILAYQYYELLSQRIGDFPVTFDMLSRFRSKHTQQEIVRKVREGKIDIIIGTHRLLSEDVEFKNLGLLIVDEEQKFGVAHKERIKKMRIGIDVLTFTATPIPRTLYMGLVGIKQISIISTPPKERLAVKTKVAEFSPSVIKEAVLREIRRKGQVFFIHNRIDTIEQLGRSLQKIFAGKLDIHIVHGRMPTKKVEEIMLAFIERKINFLLSTAIVESGIDIPRANTIIINNAHQFGLADLHQLRGRVGRLNVQAYAYFLVPDFAKVSSLARKRLELIERFSHLGSGFDIAMHDLELRGAGNLLGYKQHGFVWEIGFDLYCRLLKKEIEYLKEAFKIEVGR